MDLKAKGPKHWLVLIAACAMSASSFGISLNVIGVFYTPVAESLGVYRGTFAVHATLSSLALAIVTLYFSQLLNRFGWKPLLTFGVLLASLSTAAMAFTTQMWVFYILGTLRGLGAGLFAAVPVSLVINNWFEEKKGLAMSIAFGSSGITGAIFSPIFTSLIDSIGWESTFIIMGATIFLIALPAILIPYSLNPKDDGYLPYGFKQVKNGKNRPVIKQVDWSNFSLFNSVFILLGLVAVLHTSLTGISQHFPGFAESKQLTPHVGGLMLSAVMIGNITFKLLIGFISDYIGAAKSTVIIIGINAVSIVMLLASTQPTIAIISSFIFGSVFAIPSVLLPLLTTDFFGRERYVRIYPVISFFAGIGGALSMSVVGYVYDFTGSYVPAFITGLVFHGINVLFILVASKQSQKERL